MNVLSLEDNAKIEEAIIYLVENIKSTGTNPKPVITHSLGMAYKAINKNAKIDIILGCILHDILEDTELSYETLKSDFGYEIADLVQACSFNPKIKDFEKSYTDLFNRVERFGFDAFIVKTLDISSNAPYIKYVKSRKKQLSLIKRNNFFLQKFNGYKETFYWKELENINNGVKLNLELY